jgi:hypothetical protein
VNGIQMPKMTKTNNKCRIKISNNAASTLVVAFSKAEDREEANGIALTMVAAHREDQAKSLAPSDHHFQDTTTDWKARIAGLDREDPLVRLLAGSRTSAGTAFGRAREVIDQHRDEHASGVALEVLFRVSIDEINCNALVSNEWAEEESLLKTLVEQTVGLLRRFPNCYVVQRYGISFLRMLAMNMDASGVLVELGSVPCVVAALQHYTDDLEMQEFGLGFLVCVASKPTDDTPTTSLSPCDRCNQSVFQAGALPVVMSALGTQTDKEFQLQQVGVELLGLLCLGGDAQRTAVCGAGGQRVVQAVIDRCRAGERQRLSRAAERGKEWEGEGKQRFAAVARDDWIEASAVMALMCLGEAHVQQGIREIERALSSDCGAFRYVVAELLAKLLFKQLEWGGPAAEAIRTNQIVLASEEFREEQVRHVMTVRFRMQDGQVVCGLELEQKLLELEKKLLSVGGAANLLLQEEHLNAELETYKNAEAKNLMTKLLATQDLIQGIDDDLRSRIDEENRTLEEALCRRNTALLGLWEEEEARERKQNGMDRDYEGMDDAVFQGDYETPLVGWIAQKQIRKEIVYRFSTFLTTFTDDHHQRVYMAKISALCAANEQSLMVSYLDLRSAAPTLADWVADAPIEMIHILDQAAMSLVLMQHPSYSQVHREVFVRITELPDSDAIRDLNQVELNALVKVRGVLTRRSSVFPELKMARYNCTRCKHTFGPYPLSSDQREHRVGPCPECQQTGPFTLSTEGGAYRNYQKITLQETLETVPQGEVPQQQEIVLTGDLIGQLSGLMRLGEEIEVTGAYSNQFYDRSRKNGYPVFCTDDSHLLIHANYLQTMPTAEEAKKEAEEEAKKEAEQAKKEAEEAKKEAEEAKKKAKKQAKKKKAKKKAEEAKKKAKKEADVREPTPNNKKPRTKQDKHAPRDATVAWPLWPLAQDTIVHWEAGYETACAFAVPMKEKGTALLKEGDPEGALKHYCKGLYQFEHLSMMLAQLHVLCLGASRCHNGNNPLQLFASKTNRQAIFVVIGSYLCSSFREPCVRLGNKMNGWNLNDRPLQRVAAECASNASLMLRKLQQPDKALLMAITASRLDRTFMRALDREVAALNICFAGSAGSAEGKKLLQMHMATIDRKRQLFSEDGMGPGNAPPWTMASLLNKVVPTTQKFAELEQWRAVTALEEMTKVLPYTGKLDQRYNRVMLSCSLVPFTANAFGTSTDDVFGQWLNVSVRWFNRQTGDHSVNTFHLSEADPLNGDDLELPPHGRPTARALEFTCARIVELSVLLQRRYCCTRGEKPIITIVIELGQGLRGLLPADPSDNRLSTSKLPFVKEDSGGIVHLDHIELFDRDRLERRHTHASRLEQRRVHGQEEECRPS